ASIDPSGAAEVDDCRWTPCFECGVCPAMDTEIETGPTGKRLLPLSVVRNRSSEARDLSENRDLSGAEGPSAEGFPGSGGGFRPEGDAGAHAVTAGAASVSVAAAREAGPPGGEA